MINYQFINFYDVQIEQTISEIEEVLFKYKDAWDGWVPDILVRSKVEEPNEPTEDVDGNYVGTIFDQAIVYMVDNHLCEYKVQFSPLTGLYRLI